MDNIIVCKNIKKRYGKKKVFQDLSLEIKPGQIVGLLGPNGSGKTTLIKILAGILQSDSGTTQIDGMKIGIKTKDLVSYLPERTYLDGSMRIKDAIEFFKDFYKDFKPEAAVQMVRSLGLELDDKIKTLSKGNREKVQLILVMSRKAKLYLLDEPIGGVDPAARDYILRTIIGNYNPEASVIISTHLISDVEKILDDIVFIKQGEIVLHQSADSIRQEKQKSVDELFREVFAC